MPTYQYRCTNPECGNAFELVQSFTDPAASECPVCGGPVRKVFSSVGVVFKGSGFYRNDSRSENRSNSGSTSKSDDTPSSSAKKETSSSTDSSSSSSTAAKSTDTKTSSTTTSSSSGSSSTRASA